MGGYGWSFPGGCGRGFPGGYGWSFPGGCGRGFPGGCGRGSQGGCGRGSQGGCGRGFPGLRGTAKTQQQEQQQQHHGRGQMALLFLAVYFFGAVKNGIEQGQDDHGQQGGSDQSPDDHRSQGALHLSPCRCGNGHGQEAQGCGRGRHHYRTEAFPCSRKNSLMQIRHPLHFKVLQVFYQNYSIKYCNAEEGDKSHACRDAEGHSPGPQEENATDGG